MDCVYVLWALRVFLSSSTRQCTPRSSGRSGCLPPFLSFLFLGMEDLCRARCGYCKGINFTQTVFRNQVSATMQDDVRDYLQSYSIDGVGLDTLASYRLGTLKRVVQVPSLRVAMGSLVSRKTITVCCCRVRELSRGPRAPCPNLDSADTSHPSPGGPSPSSAPTVGGDTWPRR